MACCNNECLEPIYSNCVEHAGDPLLCVQGDNLTEQLASIDTMLNELYCNPDEEVEGSVSVDLKCINNNCGGNLTYTLSFVKGPENSVIGVLPTDFGVPFLASIKVYSSGSVVASQEGITTLPTPSLFLVPTSYVNITGVTVVITVMINGMTYVGSYYIGPSTPNGSFSGLTLVCQAPPNVVTLGQQELFQLLINEMCIIKSLLG
ncbi:MAG TPA: hypothetical protein PKD00_09915 [Burkholderiales bacterium]|nr:hypothetical protein [Burkholderiales bacterium]